VVRDLSAASSLVEHKSLVSPRGHHEFLRKQTFGPPRIHAFQSASRGVFGGNIFVDQSTLGACPSCQPRCSSVSMFGGGPAIGAQRTVQPRRSDERGYCSSVGSVAGRGTAGQQTARKDFQGARQTKVTKVVAAVFLSFPRRSKPGWLPSRAGRLRLHPRRFFPS